MFCLIAVFCGFGYCVAGVVVFDSVGVFTIVCW